MNKTGLYLQQTNANGIREMLLQIRPATVLVHLDGGDLASWIRQNLPETFITGRRYWTEQEQDFLLGTTGAAIAGQVLATKGADDCHAFILFNESMTSPVDHGEEPAFVARAAQLDRLQVDYRAALVAKGFEAVAFNFGAGNWPTWEHYQEHFPLTMAAYKYLGFHVYAWPTLTSGDWHSSLGETLRIIDGLPDYTCVLTEIAITRAYAQPGPDEGWLSSGDGAPLSLDAYAGDLAAVHGELNKRANVLGSCLFNAAPLWDWASFAVTPELVTRIATFPSAPIVVTPPPVPVPVRLRMPFNHADPVGRVTQWYGEGKGNPTYKPWAHEGIDFALNAGYDVLAACDGVVDAFKVSAAYGTYIRILSDGTLETADGKRTVKGKFQTVYAHLLNRTVKAGQKVKAGDKIGEVGSTGNSTGNHLHFGLRLPGQKPSDPYWGYSDPAPWLGIHKAVVVPPKPPAKTTEQLIAEAKAMLKEVVTLLTQAEDALRD